MVGKVEYNESKFTELVLYVASRLLGDPANGSVKLNKVLFFSDFFHYANQGEPITGVQYIARPLGPAPAGIKQLQEDLIRRNEVSLATARAGTRVQKMLVPLREANLEQFKATEIAQVEHVISVLRETTGMEASDVSHAMLAWSIRQQGEPIPYHSVFIYDGPVTEEEEQLAREVTERLRTQLEQYHPALAS